MNNKIVKNFQISVNLILAFVFLISSLYTYRNDFHYAYELTFLSNFLTGLFLLIAGILTLCKKKIPQFLFLNFTILLLIVFIVSVSFFADFNFKGGFAFLHIVNPLLMLLFYLFFSDQTAVTWKFLLTIWILPFIYLIFALVFGALSGQYIYFFLNYPELGIHYTILLILGILIGLTVVSIGLYFFNRYLHRHLLKYPC